MANAAAAAKKAPPSSPSKVSAEGIGAFLKQWISKNRYYIIAFFIPVVLMYISYAIFGLYPFGEHSVLALDFNAQYVYYFESLRDSFWSFDKSIFYDWGRNLSGGFMGIIGYYLASPFTLIVMLLPRKMILTSLLIMILCKIGTASVTMSIYLQHSKRLAPMQATVFSVLFSMCAYMVIQTVDPMWLDGLVFLPLIALGVEHLIDDGRKLGYIIPIALMFIANFYIGYMIGIFTAFYFLYYLLFGSEESRGKIMNYVYICINFGISTIVAVMLAAWMILPVYNALQLGKFDFTDPDYSFAVQFEPITVLAQLLISQYDSVNVQGSPEIYCGILTVVLLPIFFLNSKIPVRQKLGYGFLLCVMFFSMYIKPVDMWWHGGQVPNWLPFRYSFIISFILLSMAAVAFKHLDGIKPSYLGGIFFGILATVLYIHSQGFEHLDIMSSIWLSIGLSAAYLMILYAATNKNIAGKTLPLVLLCVIAGELVFNNVRSMKALDKEVAYSTRASYEVFMESGREAVKRMEQRDSGLYRSEKTFTRCINDNEGWGLKGLTHSSSVMNAKILTFLETLGYNSRSYYTRYEGTTELGDSLLGIKYVIDRGPTTRPLLHDAYTQVDSYTYTDRDDLDANGQPREKYLNTYENPNALPIAYMVDDDLLRIDHLGNDNPFNSQNVLLSSMLGKTVFDEAGNIAGNAQYYTRIDVGEPVLGAVTLDSYNGQACYRRQEGGDPTVDYRFTADSDREVFCYLKTENEQAVNLWLGTRESEDTDYAFKGYGQYFETHNYSIISLGKFQPGTQVCLRLTVLEKDNATIIKEPFFYYFDRDAFQADIDQLKASGQMEITKYTDRYIKGTVNASDGQILFTSIPYEPGWTVKVDGHRVDTMECLKAMIYVPLTAGTHTVVLSYTPPGFVLGVILMILGVGMLVLFYMYDKKNNPVLLARANARAAEEKAAKKAAKSAKKDAKPAAPAVEAPAKEEKPSEDAPAEEAPAEETPAEETPAEDASADEA